MKKINTKNDKYIFEILTNPRFEISKEGKITHDGYEQKYRLNKYGYPFYRLTRNGKKINLLIHRIVWAKYGDKPLEEGLVINHIDGNKENNDISNLELVYQAENNKHAYKAGLRKPVKGHVVNSQEFANQIRQDHTNGMSYNTIITKYRNMGYKIGKSYVSQIINNKIWKKEETMLDPSFVQLANVGDVVFIQQLVKNQWNQLEPVDFEGEVLKVEYDEQKVEYVYHVQIKNTNKVVKVTDIWKY